MKHSNFKTNVHNLVLAAMFLALALVLPFLTGQIPQIGGMLLPMHLPVFLCGLICGWQYGAVVGFVAPLMRMALFGMPPLVAAVAMAFELAAYGGIAGFLYNRSRWQCVVALYRALLAAMVGGRIVWAAVRVVMTGVASVPFTWQIFLTEALVNAIPGIILQLVFIPVLMVALDRTGSRFRREQAGPRPPETDDRRLLSQASRPRRTGRSGPPGSCLAAHRLAGPPSWGAGSALPGNVWRGARIVPAYFAGCTAAQ
ncbi:MAG: ECF transporter S component [Dysosmobacter welbionis]